MKIIEAYECEHCNKLQSFELNAMRIHEINCNFNPDLKCCVTCKYWHKATPHYMPYCDLGAVLDVNNWVNKRCVSWEPKAKESNK